MNTSDRNRAILIAQILLFIEWGVFPVAVYLFTGKTVDSYLPRWLFWTWAISLVYLGVGLVVLWKCLKDCYLTVGAFLLAWVLWPAGAAAGSYE